MPLSNLLKSAAGTCPFCRQKAGILFATAAPRGAGYRCGLAVGLVLSQS